MKISRMAMAWLVRAMMTVQGSKVHREMLLKVLVKSTTIERLRYRFRGDFQCSKVVNSDGQRA
jgi:hypothetical protein